MKNFNGKFKRPEKAKPAILLLKSVQAKGLAITNISKESSNRTLRENETVHVIGNDFIFFKWSIRPTMPEVIVADNIVSHLKNLVS